MTITKTTMLLKWKQMPISRRWMLIGLVFVGISAGLYFGIYQQQLQANQTAGQRVQTLQSENAQLEQFRPRLRELDAQIASLEQQMEAGRRIVPDDEESPQFMRLLQGEAHKSGVDIRRFTARPVAQHDFYAEAPFEVELDGNYFQLLNFFERVGQLERMVNISGLVLASTRNPQAAATRRTYAYLPSETVVATCVATAFYSHDSDDNNDHHSTAMSETGKAPGSAHN